MLRKSDLLMPNMLVATMFLVMLSKTETPVLSLQRARQLLLLSSVQARIITDMVDSFRPVSVRMAPMAKDMAHNAAGITTANPETPGRLLSRSMARAS
nr:MAG TPA: hypothetical protein [Caudoviricetes sp.]